MHDLRAIGRERRVFGDRRLHAHLDAFKIGDLLDRLLSVHVAQALRAQPEHVRTFDLGRIQLLHRRNDCRIAEHLDRMVFVAEYEVDGKHAGFRLRSRGIGGRQQHEVDVTGLHLLHV